MKYDLSRIMRRAWRLYRKTVDLSFGEALHRSWISAKAEPVNEKRVQAAKERAGIAEEVKTWSGWKEAGFEVIHGSKGDGAIYKARFFGASQVQAVA